MNDVAKRPSPARFTLALTAAAALAVAAAACGPKTAATVPPPGGEPVAAPALAPDLTPAEIERRLAQFATARIDFDDTALEPWEKQVLAKLVSASQVMDELFALQVSPKVPAWRDALVASGASPAVLAYYDIMVGPWDRLDHGKPFLDVGPKPRGAGFYPPDLTSEEIERWLAAHPEDKAAFNGYFSVIRRQGDRLVAVPYSEAWRPQIERAATLLREAADLSKNVSLTAFLRARADALLSNDYYQSDMLWMDLDSRIEPVIGPYEVYEDELMGWKAAFESFITVEDAAASAELARLKGLMRDLEQALPIDDQHKNLTRGFESPIRVVDVAFTAGDTKAGVQTIAFNLPNDERVREAKGSKKVLLRNVMRAKFERIVAPIAAEVLAPATGAQVEFQPWFINVLMHELAHGLGPGTITLPSGEKTTTNLVLKELYPASEEAKADVTGLHSMSVLGARGLFDEAFVRKAYLGHLADLFRAVRFGAAEAHGRGVLLQFNFFREKGAITLDEASGRFDVDLTKLVAANRELAGLLLTLQAKGDYEGTKALLDRYASEMQPGMKAALERLAGKVPVDIHPEYTVTEKMKGW